MKYLTKSTAMFLALFFFALIGFSVPKHESYNVSDPENCRLSFSVVSDSHIEGNNLPRFKSFMALLGGIKANERKNDAVVFLGDNTMNGQDIENMLFGGAILRANFKTPVLVAEGNHDVGNGEDDYNKLTKRFLSYANNAFDLGIEKPYYYKEIGGYYFIVLSSEWYEGNEVHGFSDEQLIWLNGVVQKASAEGKPVFVFGHYTFWEVKSENHNLVDILTKYKNVYYFHGHNHADFDEYSLSYFAGTAIINLPKWDNLPDGEISLNGNTGAGVLVEVYGDRVVVKGRDFITDRPLAERTYKFDGDNYDYVIR